jgi:hypothetical protein
VYIKEMTIRQLIILHHHGAQYPPEPLHGDISWPIKSQFWEDYHEYLTPVGTLQQTNIGKDLRKYYQEFISDIKPHEVRSYSSNFQKTTTSSWSFLLGLLPTIPAHYRFLGDSRDIKLRNNVAINIESQISKDKLFYVLDSETKKLCYENIISSPLLQSLCNQEYQDLCNKIFCLTKNNDFAENRNLIDRIIALHKISMQLNIAEIHDLEFFSNILTQSDIENIHKASKEIIRCLYIPTSGKISDNILGKKSSYLLHEIFRHSNSNKYKFVQFSGNEDTLLSLSSLLGIDIEIPNFSSYFLFEIYTDNTVKVYYNSQPTVYKRSELFHKYWHSSEYYHKYSTLGAGSFTIKELGHRYKLFDMLTLIESIKISCLTQSILTVTSEPVIDELFGYIDEQNIGKINFDEFSAFIDRLDLSISCKKIKNLFDSIDSDKNGYIDLKEFRTRLIKYYF